MGEVNAAFGPDGLPRAIEPSSLHVLVVDRGDESRERICDLLRESGYQVTGIKHGKQAIDILKQSNSKYDLVMKEHEPPKVNGCKLLREMIRDEKLQSIPVVVVSTKDDAETVARCTHLGAADYLVKPLRSNELRHIWTRVWWKRAGHAHRPPMILLDNHANPLKRTRSLDGMDESSFNSSKADSGGNHPSNHMDKKSKEKTRKGSTGSTADLAQEDNHTTSAFKSFPSGVPSKETQKEDVEKRAQARASGMDINDHEGLHMCNARMNAKHVEDQPEEDLMMSRPDSGQRFPCPMLMVPPGYHGPPFSLPQMGASYPQFYPMPYMYGMSPPMGMGSQTYQSSGSFPSWPGSHSNSGGNGQRTSDAHVPTNGTNGNSGSGGTSGEKESAQQVQLNQVEGLESVPDHTHRRQLALDKFKLKKKMLNFSKKIRYSARKKLADARPRVRGQFVKLNAEPDPVVE